MFYGKCDNKKCSNRAKRRFKLIVPWVYAYCGGEVLWNRYCSEKCLELGKKAK